MAGAVFKPTQRTPKTLANATDYGSQATFSFGCFVLDPAERRLLRAGTPVPLTPKAFTVLLALLENAGHLVRKDALLRRAWPGTIVEEANLSVQVSRVRRLLGRRDDGGAYVETVRKFGYRFAAPVAVQPPAQYCAMAPLQARLAMREPDAVSGQAVRLTVSLTRLSDGATLWRKTIEGVLSEPANADSCLPDELRGAIAQRPGTADA